MTKQSMFDKMLELSVTIQDMSRVAITYEDRYLILSSGYLTHKISGKELYCIAQTRLDQFYKMAQTDIGKTNKSIVTSTFIEFTEVYNRLLKFMEVTNNTVGGC